MNRSLEMIKQDIESLPEPERASLIEWMNLQLDSEEIAAIDQDWLKVSQQRLEDLKTGKVEPVSGESVMQKIRDRYGFDL